MSSYPPPTNYVPSFNAAEYDISTTAMTYALADARYLKLSGGIETGLVTFNGGFASSSYPSALVTLTGTQSLTNKTFTDSLNTLRILNSSYINCGIFQPYSGTNFIFRNVTAGSTLSLTLNTRTASVWSTGDAIALNFGDTTDNITATKGTSFVVNATSPISLSGGIVNVTDSTDSSSSTTGALKVTGGLGVAKKLYVGTSLNIAGSLGMKWYDSGTSSTVASISAATGGNIAVTFNNTAPSTTGMVVLVVNSAGSGLGKVNGAAGSSTYTTSGFTLYYYNSSAGAVTNTVFQWVAYVIS